MYSLIQCYDSVIWIMISVVGFHQTRWQMSSLHHFLSTLRWYHQYLWASNSKFWSDWWQVPWTDSCGEAWLSAGSATVLRATGFVHWSRDWGLQAPLHHHECWLLCVEVSGETLPPSARYMSESVCSSVMLCVVGCKYAVFNETYSNFVQTLKIVPFQENSFALPMWKHKM